MAHMVKCVKMGREMEGLDEPPFDGELGQRIYNNVSKLAWEQWQEHMKMLLNEYRLQPWKKEHQEFIVQQMDAYFFGEGAERTAVPTWHAVFEAVAYVAGMTDRFAVGIAVSDLGWDRERLPRGVDSVTGR